jgi:hypothetical protein
VVLVPSVGLSPRNDVDRSGFYTGTNLLAFFFTFLFMRETKQLTLEELDQVSQ